MTLRAIDLFCGAGGSSFGARSAGATIVAGVDAWDRAIATFEANFGSATALHEVLDDSSRPPRALRDSGIDLIIASPECTNHSCAKGNKPRDEESRRSARYVLGYAKALRPRWLIIENVVQMRSWKGFRAFCDELRALKYNLNTQVIDAVEFGVPQTRRRLFLLADREIPPPLITSSRQAAAKSAQTAVRVDGPWPSRPLFSPNRADATIARAERAMRELGKGVPFLIVYYGSDGSGGWQTLDRPLRTLTTLDRFGLVTWDGRTPMLRMLQVDELKRAMGFPANFAMPHGSRREKIMLLGNAVCPPVMKAIVDQLCIAQSAKRAA